MLNGSKVYSVLGDFASDPLVLKAQIFIGYGCFIAV